MAISLETKLGCSQFHIQAENVVNWSEYAIHFKENNSEGKRMSEYLILHIDKIAIKGQMHPTRLRCCLEDRCTGFYQTI